MTRQEAFIMAGIVPMEIAKVLVGFGKVNIGGIDGATVDYIKNHGLIEHVKSLQGRWAWVLTADGKQVVKELKKLGVEAPTV